MSRMPREISDNETDRPLRRDAVRNRELILETAAAVFAEHGIEAGYDEIARRAGIGVGTVYRRFPERAELVRALFQSRVEEIVSIAEQAARMPDAFEALAWFLEKSLERQVTDRGLKEVMAGTITQDDHRMIGPDRLAPILADVLLRAQAEGTLRADVGVTDLGAQLMLVELDVHAGPAPALAALPGAAHGRTARSSRARRPAARAAPGRGAARPHVQPAGSLTLRGTRKSGFVRIWVCPPGSGQTQVSPNR